MEIDQDSSDISILTEIGNRVAATRLELYLTQSELAAKAGVSKRTVERIEAGEVSTQIITLIRVLRALMLIDRLDLLVPAATISPIELLRMEGRRRKRASHTKPEPHKKWTWGEPS